MSSPAFLKVVLGDNSSQRLTFQNGLPGTVDELVHDVQRQCGLTSSFRLQFMDSLFRNDFMNLTSVEEVQDRGTIRVIPLAAASHPQCTLRSSTSVLANIPESSSSSSGSVDTDIPSTPESDQSCSRPVWPSIFSVPQFTYDAELKLEHGNAAHREGGTPFLPDSKLRSSILEGLIQEVVKYKLYVSDKQWNDVGKALITKHPCLTEKGSFSGYAGWKMSLKNKLAISRTHLRKLGCREVLVNSIQNKPRGRANAALGIKKSKRSEVNYCPPYPTGECEESLEKLRRELLSDVKRRDNRETVRIKMEKTFASRRYDVVRDTPMIQDFQARWPALFEVDEINAEFKRITTMPLQSRFLFQLDMLSDKLLKLVKNRGGQIGKRLESILACMTEVDDVDVDDDVDRGRECILKALCVYLNEDPECLLREFVAEDEIRIQEGIEETTVGIYVVKQDATSRPDDIGIVLEGQQVEQDLDNVALAVAMLFGLMYALNLNYPDELKYTFEVLQKIMMELEGTMLLKKVQVLKNRLCE